MPDNEFVFVRFFGRNLSGRIAPHTEQTMFVFNRSVIAVLAPLALLLAVVLWSNAGDVASAREPQVAAVGRGAGEREPNPPTLTASNARGTPSR